MATGFKPLDRPGRPIIMYIFLLIYLSFAGITVFFRPNGTKCYKVHGHVFTRHISSTAGKVRWRCRMYNMHLCKASFWILNGKIIKYNLYHNH